MLTVKETTPTTTETAGVFGKITKMGHEQVVFCHDEATGLKSIIAVHNTTLGPSLGGTRFWNYKTEEEALADVLRLSRGMTYKSAISGINLGGGKAVIIGDSDKLGGEAFWRRYGKFVDSLGGKYISAEDVGTSTQDMEYVMQETKYVTGIPEYLGGGGDPSPVTAYGVYLGIKASAKVAWGSDNLEGRKVFVEGAGHVGTYLIEYLAKEGAEILVTDIRDARVKNAVETYGAVAVDANMALDLDFDIYAPCALGATLDTKNVDRLKCAIVAGAANNQFADEIVNGRQLHDKGILYAPDFLINAGGVINCYAELQGYNRERAQAGCEMIYQRTLDIYQKSADKNITTHQAAIEIAQDRIDSIAMLKTRR